MLLIVLMVMAFLCFLIGAGIVVAAVGFLLLFGFVSLGVISASVMVGLHQKSLSFGFRTAVYLFGAIGGVFLGMVAFPLLGLVLEMTQDVGAPMLLGGACGLIAGLLSGHLFLRMLSWTGAHFRRKINMW